MKRALSLLVAAVALTAHAATAPTPDSVLGLKLGEDRTLADWEQAQRYFKALDAASDRVRVDDVGRTTEGRPFLIVTITSEANQRRLEEIRQANLRLWDPRGLQDDEAERLIAKGKTIVALNHGIHSDEVAASQTALETAYALATAEDAGTLEILDNTVILMLPSHNPDGMQKVTDWYRKTLGTPYEGAEQPFLYQHYTGHDNNRDWYMFTQAETRLTLTQLYDRWRPQLVHDLHQMGEKGARIFVPPYVDPIEPNVDPSLRSALSAIGTQMAASLTAEGKSGVVVRAIYDGWSPSRAYPHTHGGLRVLSEVASARYATPLEVRFDELRSGIGYDPKLASWNFPLPWRGGRWRLRDIMDYQLSATRALLEHAAKNREFWLRNFLAVNRRASMRNEPFAFVIPASSRDPLATAKLLEVLHTGAVELKRASAAFEAGGRSFAAGSHVVSMAQPASAFAKTVLEKQQYPEIRPYPSAPLQEPYDATAHTLPLLLGAEAVAIAKPFEAPLEAVATLRVAPGSIDGRGPSIALGHRTAELIALGRLLRAGVEVRWATVGFRDRGRDFAAGTLLVPASARAQLEELARELGLMAHAVSARPKALVLAKPRIGLYQSARAAVDEGWTRYVFEHDMGVEYKTLRDKEVRAGGLRARFDAIVLPDQTPEQIVEGHAPGTLPDEFTGGLGDEGVRALKRFVMDGGSLVALNGAALLTLEDFGIDNVTGSVDKELSAPGSILRARVDGTQPLAHGLGETSIVWFEDSPVFEAPAGQVVMRYDEPNPLLSGFLAHGEKLQGKAALVEARLGRGRVVLFGFRPQYRAQSWATYVPFLNSLYLSAATGPR
jgi:hypothetical protein